MKKSIYCQKLRRARLSTQLFIGVLVSGFATTAAARAVAPVPEPSMLSLIGAGAIVAIVAYRMRGGK